MKSPPLGELYDLLRADGFAIGVDDHVRIGRLLERTAPWTEASLRIAVRSLVAKDVRERAAFDAVWTRWLAVPGPTPVPIAAPAAPKSLPVARLVAFATLAVVLIAGVVLVVTRDRGGKQVAAARPDAAPIARAATDAGPAIDAAPAIDASTKSPPDARLADYTPPPPSSTAPDAAVERVAVTLPVDAGPATEPAIATQTPPRAGDDPGISATTALLLGGAGVLVFAIALVIATALARRRRAFVPGPWTYRRVVPETTATALDREDVEDGAAHLTWQPLAEGGGELDVDRTVHRTLEAGGLPSFAYRPPPPAPEYLVLEDLAGGAERWRPLFDELLRGLAREGVRLQRFTFVGSPELCTPAGGGAVSSLRDLAEHGDALIVIGDGAEAIDPDTGKPAAWLDTLRHVPRRLWINPLPPARWSEAARLIGEQTPMEHGVAHALHALHAGVDRRDPPTHAYPRVIDRAPASDAGIDALRLHLGGAAFRALALTAAAGDATGPATRWIAQRFAIGLDEGAWLRLVSLPWLAERKWPAGLRERLAHELPPELAPDAERALAEVLAASEPRPGSAAHLRWELDRANASTDPLAAVSALSGLASTPLHAEAARRLQVAGVPDLRRRAAFALAILGIGLTAIAGARWTWRTTGPKLAPSLVAQLAVTTHPERATGMRRLTIDRVEATPVGDRTQLRFEATPIDLATAGSVLEVEDDAWKVTVDGAEVQPTSVARAEPGELAIMFAVQSSLGEQFGEAIGEPLANLADGLPDSVPARVQAFAGDVEPVDDAQDPATTIRSLPWGESTVEAPALARAVDRGIAWLAAQRPADGGPLRRVLVVIADGRDPSYDALQPDRDLANGAIARLAERADRVGVRIDAIAFSPFDERGSLKALGELSARTHGVFRWVQKLVDAGSAANPVDKLRQELAHASVITVEVPGTPARLAVSAGPLRSTEVRIPPPSCHGIVCGLGTTCDGSRCVAPPRRSNAVASVLRPAGLVLCAIGLALLLHLAWIRARFGRLGLRLVGHAPAPLPRAIVLALIAIAAAVTGAVAGALVWRSIAPPPAAVASGPIASAWPSTAHEVDLRVEPAPPGVDRAPDIVARVSSGDATAFDAVQLVQGDPGEEQIVVPVSSIKPYGEGDEPLGLVAVVDDHPSWMTAARHDAIAGTLATLAQAGPPGSRGALVVYRDHAVVSATPQLLWTLTDHGGEVTQARFRPDGAQLVTTSVDGKARIWDVATGELVRTLEGHTDAIRAVTYDAPGERLVTGSDDQTARIWDAATGQTIVTLEGHRDAVDAVDISAAHPGVLTVSKDGTARLWDLRTTPPSPSDFGEVSRAAFDAAGERYALVDNNGSLTVDDIAAGTTARMPRAGVKTIAWSQTGSLLATAFDNGDLSIFDPVTGQTKQELHGPSPVWRIAWNATGTRLATADQDGVARVWNLDTSTLVAELRGHRGMISDLAFAPDGDRLATVGDDRVVRLWRVSDGALAASLDGHTARIATVMWSADGTRLVTASDDGTARVWRVAGRAGDQLDASVPLVELASQLPSASDRAVPGEPALTEGLEEGLAQLARMTTPRKLLVVIGEAATIDMPGVDTAVLSTDDELATGAVAIVAGLDARWYARFPGADLAWDGQMHSFGFDTGDGNQRSVDLRLAPRWTPPSKRPSPTRWPWIAGALGVLALAAVSFRYRRHTAGVIALALLALLAGGGASIAVRRALATAPVAAVPEDAAVDLDAGPFVLADEPDAASEAVAVAAPDAAVIEDAASLDVDLAAMKKTTAKLVDGWRCASALRQLDALVKRAKAAGRPTKDITKLRTTTLADCKDPLRNERIPLQLDEPSHIQEVTKCFAKTPLAADAEMRVYIDAAGDAFDVEIDGAAAKAVACVRSATARWGFAKLTVGFIGVYSVTPGDLGTDPPHEAETPKEIYLGVDTLEDKATGLTKSPWPGRMQASLRAEIASRNRFVRKWTKGMTAYQLTGSLDELSTAERDGKATVTCKAKIVISAYPDNTILGQIGNLGAKVDGPAGEADVEESQRSCVDAIISTGADRAMDEIERWWSPAKK